MRYSLLLPLLAACVSWAQSPLCGVVSEKRAHCRWEASPSLRDADRLTLPLSLKAEKHRAYREGATDVGVIMAGTQVDGLECFAYKADQLVAVVPKQHALRNRALFFSSLLDYDFITLDGATATTRTLIDQAAVGRKPLRARIQVHSFAALCKLVESGLGVAVMPEVAARSFIAAMDLRAIKLNDEWARHRRMYVCVREYSGLPAIARKLVDHLVRVAAESE
mgnify:CR=1 FL=1